MKTANRIEITRNFRNTAHRLVLYNSKSQLKIKISAKPHQRKPLPLPKNQRMAVPS